jgi:hypothetical protein
LFALKDDGTLVHVQSGLCLQATGMAGTRLQLATCNKQASQSWLLSDNGSIEGYGGAQDLCVDVGLASNDLNRFYGSDNYYRLQLFGCNGQPNQMFSLAGPIVGLGGKCAEVAAAARSNGTAVRLRGCTGETNQVWEYYW